jgi:tight adherence protein B
MTAIAASLFVFLAILAVSGAVLGRARSRREMREERIRTLMTDETADVQPGPPALTGPRSLSVVLALRRLLSRGASSDAAARDLRRAHLPLRAGELFLVRLLLAVTFFVVTALLLAFHPIGLLVGLASALLGYLLPGFCLRVMQRRRATKIEKQLVELLPMLASSLRSGLGLSHGLEVAARQLSPPLAEELALLLNDVRLGAAMHVALQELGRRVGNADLDIVITAILVQRTTGGNLAEVLDKAGQTLLERERVRGDLQTMTTQQRLTGTVLSVYPIVVGLILLAMMPAMWSRLFTEPVGQIQLAIALSLQVLGFLAIRRALSVEY